MDKKKKSSGPVKGWLVVRSVSGEKFLCRCPSNIRAHDMSKPIVITEVREIITLNLPMPGSEVSRRTTLADIDFHDGPRPYMNVMLSSWYPLEDSEKEYVEIELKEANERTERAKKMAAYMKKLDDPDITDAERKEIIKEATGRDLDAEREQMEAMQRQAQSREAGGPLIAMPGKDFILGAPK